MKARSEFQVTQWNETNLESFSTDLPMTRASVVYEANGEIAGTFQVEYIMHATHFDADDPHNAETTYVGYMVFTGSIAGKTGSFTVEENGVYANSAPRSDLLIKPQTGTGDFLGISGTGKYYAEGEKMIMELDYSLAK